jgi:hypothetical protein
MDYFRASRLRYAGHNGSSPAVVTASRSKGLSCCTLSYFDLIFATTIAAVSGIAAHAQSVATDESPFLAENAAVMDKMMTDMAVKPTGDVDADFAAMMIPHHRGAIDLALAQPR